MSIKNGSIEFLLLETELIALQMQAVVAKNDDNDTSIEQLRKELLAFAEKCKSLLEPRPQPAPAPALVEAFVATTLFEISVMKELTTIKFSSDHRSSKDARLCDNAYDAIIDLLAREQKIAEKREACLQVLKEFAMTGRSDLWYNAGDALRELDEARNE